MFKCIINYLVKEKYEKSLIFMDDSHKLIFLYTHSILLLVEIIFFTTFQTRI